MNQISDATSLHTALERGDVAQASPGSNCETFNSECLHRSKKSGRVTGVEEATCANSYHVDLHRGDRDDISHAIKPSNRSRGRNQMPEKPRVPGYSSSLQQLETISGGISGLHHKMSDLGLSSPGYPDSYLSLPGNPTDLGSPDHSNKSPTQSLPPQTRLEEHDRSLEESGSQRKSGSSRRSRRNTSISINQTLAIEVLAIGNCDYLTPILQLLGQTPKCRDYCALKGTSPSTVPAKMTILRATLQKNGKVDWIDSEPITDISHCLGVMAPTDLPKLIITSSTLVDDNPGFLQKFFQNMQHLTGGIKQSSIFLLVAENEVRSNHGTIFPEGLKSVLNKSVHSIWLWRETEIQGLAEKLENFVHKNAASREDTKSFLNLAQAVFSERQRSCIVGIQEFQRMANGLGCTVNTGEVINRLERKGYVLGSRFCAQRNFNGDPNHLSTSSEDSTFFLVLDPLWFYGTLNTVIDTIVHQRQTNVVPIARHRGFYSPSKVDEVLRQCVPETSRKAFSDTCQAYNYINIIDDATVCSTSDVVTASNRAPNYRGSYFIPATLIFEKLPPICGRHVSLAALRSPGIYRVHIPLSAFYDLVLFLAKHFPVALKCAEYKSRFNPAPSHVLELQYADEGTHIRCTVSVDSEDPTGYSTRTPAVCSAVRALLMSHVSEINQKFPGLNLQFAAVLESVDSDGHRYSDFVDLNDMEVTSTCQLFSIGNQPFRPSNFLLWYGGIQQTSIIHKDFLKLSKEIDGLAAAGWLFQEAAITIDELDDISRIDPPARSYRLLLTLAKRQDHGEALLKQIQQNPDLKARNNQTSKSISTSLTNSSFTDTGVSSSVSGNTLSTATLKGKSRSQAGDIDSTNSPVMVDATNDGESVADTSDYGRDRPVPWSPDGQSVNISNTGLAPRGVQPTAMDDEDVRGGPIQAPVHPDSLRTDHSLSASSNNTNFNVPQSAISSDGLTTVDATDSRSDQSRPRRKGDPQIHPISEAKYFHVKTATDNFNNQPKRDGGKLLGLGTYGNVYYGVLHSDSGGGEFEVAIKRLKKASSLHPSQVETSRKQFGTEMNILTRYVHSNIVRLLGFSSDGPELCLLYEHMALGALSHRLDCRDKTPPVEWQFRLTIARDISLALEFLHTQYNQYVIHCNTKSENVLLGKQYEAKLSNFGLAVVGTNDSEQQSTTVLESTGTVDSEHKTAVAVRPKPPPHLPPETIDGIMTPLVDVYGLGMVDMVWN
jgi:hypothetical protein